VTALSYVLLPCLHACPYINWVNGDKICPPPCGIKTPEPIATKFDRIDYVYEGPSKSNLVHIDVASEQLHVGEILTFWPFCSFFWDSPIRSWIFTRDSSEDIKSRNVRFLGSKNYSSYKKVHLWTSRCLWDIFVFIGCRDNLLKRSWSCRLCCIVWSFSEVNNKWQLLTRLWNYHYYCRSHLRQRRSPGQVL